MNDATKLRAFADRVEAGEDCGYAIDCGMWLGGVAPPVSAQHAIRSLDACEALHGAVLRKRWAWSLDVCRKGASAIVYPDDECLGDPDGQDGAAPAPARAWLAAILRARAVELDAQAAALDALMADDAEHL